MTKEGKAGMTKEGEAGMTKEGEGAGWRRFFLFSLGYRGIYEYGSGLFS